MVRRPMLVVVALAATFVVLALVARSQSGGVLVDGPVEDWFTVGRGTGAYRAAEWVTFLGSPQVVIVVSVLVAGALFVIGRRIEAVAVLAATAIAGLASHVGKDVIGRGEAIDPALGSEFGRGYPSGHVAAVSALLTVVLLLLVLADPSLTRAQRTGAVVVATVAVVAVAASRIALALHYFSDTIGGVLLGVGVAVAVAAVADHRRAPPNRDARRPSVDCPAGIAGQRQ